MVFPFSIKNTEDSLKKTVIHKESNPKAGSVAVELLQKMKNKKSKHKEKEVEQRSSIKQVSDAEKKKTWMGRHGKFSNDRLKEWFDTINNA